MEKKETVQKLKDSLEIVTLRSWAILYNVVALAVCLPTALVGGFTGEELRIALTVVLSILLIPVNGYLVFRIWKIFKEPEAYKFYRTKLVQPKGGRIRDTIRFTVLLEDEEGRFVVDTHSIFATHRSIGFPALEDYVNQTVTIAYNEETEEVVLIG